MEGDLKTKPTKQKKNPNLNVGGDWKAASFSRRGPRPLLVKILPVAGISFTEAVCCCSLWCSFGLWCCPLPFYCFWLVSVCTCYRIKIRLLLCVLALLSPCLSSWDKWRKQPVNRKCADQVGVLLPWAAQTGHTLPYMAQTVESCTCR